MESFTISQVNDLTRLSHNTSHGGFDSDCGNFQPNRNSLSLKAPVPRNKVASQGCPSGPFHYP